MLPKIFSVTKNLGKGRETRKQIFLARVRGYPKFCDANFIQIADRQFLAQRIDSLIQFYFELTTYSFNQLLVT